MKTRGAFKESVFLMPCERARDDEQNSCSGPLSLFDELFSRLPGSDLFGPEASGKPCSHVPVYRWGRAVGRGGGSTRNADAPSTFTFRPKVMD